MTDTIPMLYALDAEGRRLDLDAGEVLGLAVGRHNAAVIARTAEPEPDARIAAYEVKVGGAPSTILPVSAGLPRIMEAIEATLPRRRGPRPGTGRKVELERIVDAIATYCLFVGDRPTQETTSYLLGYDDQGNFARTIRRPGWSSVLDMVALRLWALYGEAVADVDERMGPTVAQRRLLARFELWFDAAPGRS